MKTKLFYYCLLFCLIGSSTHLFAQEKYTISGYLSDVQNGEKLIGANIYNARTLVGTTTNEYGFFSLTLPADSVTLAISFIGYQMYTESFLLKEDLTKNVQLKPNILLEEVEISATKNAAPLQEQTQMSTVSIPISQIQSLPTFLGEVDVLKALQLMPGVQSGSEGSSGLYVRGGGPDQNLILLDGVPVYNVSHLLGFFSVFNADAINSVQLIKGGFPARYGGRLSSIVDIRMKEGNMKKWGGNVSIGLISSKFTLEGPLVKDRTSLIISGRRTYIDLLIRPFVKSNNDGGFGGYYFYDLNAKINHRFSDKDRLYLSAYTGDDSFYYREKGEYNDGSSDTYNTDLGWGNLTAVMRWNHLYSKKLFSNATLTYSRYQLRTQTDFSETYPTNSGDTETESFLARYSSGIRDLGAKVDFDFVPNPNHYIKFGIGGTHHYFKPGATQLKEEISDVFNIDTLIGSDQFVNAVELDAYIEDDVKIGNRFKANVGLHASGFIVEDAFYKSLQPRISLRYLINSDWSVKASYAQMNQFIHLLSNSSALDLPSDLWVPATDQVKPQSSHQVAAGVAHTFRDLFELSVEGYYKKMNNLIVYKDGVSYLNSAAGWEDKVESGKGESYGLEFLVQKKLGKTTGWIGYTLSWSNRHFPNTDINLGEPFPYKYDRRHDIGMTIIHRVSKRVELSGSWVFGTGNAVTLALATYSQASTPQPGDGINFGGRIQYIEGRNEYRLGNFHRLDLGASFIKQRKRGERRFNIGLYNAYSRKNPFFMYRNRDQEGNRVFKQVSLFPILPAFSFKRSF